MGQNRGDALPRAKRPGPHYTQGDFAGHKLYALDTAGKRLAERPLQRTAQGVVLDLEVCGPAGTCAAYELVKE